MTYSYFEVEAWLGSDILVRPSRLIYVIPHQFLEHFVLLFCLIILSCDRSGLVELIDAFPILGSFIDLEGSFYLSVSVHNTGHTAGLKEQMMAFNFRQVTRLKAI